MKKFIICAMAAAVAMLSFTGCDKSSKNDSEEAHEVEVLVSAKIEGALTQALKLYCEVVDFSGKKIEDRLNVSFDGTGCEISDIYSSNKVGDSIMVRFWAEKNVELVSAKGPWNLVCDVTARFKDKPELYNNYNASDKEENEIDLTGIPNFLNLITDNVNNMFGNNFILVVKITKDGFDMYTIELE
ncbi:MAG: hypothetical protein MJY71_08280 [Bacteroidaceae bacterium]|nr:hypothetical protein [Bacteroidaceae bacterium]